MLNFKVNDPLNNQLPLASRRRHTKFFFFIGSQNRFHLLIYTPWYRHSLAFIPSHLLVTTLFNAPHALSPSFILCTTSLSHPPSAVSCDPMHLMKVTVVVASSSKHMIYVLWLKFNTRLGYVGIFCHVVYYPLNNAFHSFLLVSSSVSLSSFILAVPICESLGWYLCNSSTLSLAMLSGTCFLAPLVPTLFRLGRAIELYTAIIMCKCVMCDMRLGVHC